MIVSIITNYFCGLECVSHFFAYVAHFILLRDVWIRTQRADVAGRRDINLANHLPKLATHLPSLSLATHFLELSTHSPHLATHLTVWATHLSFKIHLYVYGSIHWLINYTNTKAFVGFS